MTLEKQIRKALDLSTWSEQRGFGSIKGPICPHCQTLNRPGTCADPRAKRRGASCEACGKAFRWRSGMGPLGFQWETWIKVTEGSNGNHGEH